ncbi:hypothetical protein CHUAL_000930 [Chamberlinius hualienensis]
MAEARSAVAELRVKYLDERKPTWKDVLNSLRKSVIRRYYRIRNSIRNGVWPTSPSNLVTVFAILFVLLLAEPAATDSFNRRLWQVEEYLYLSQGIPRLLRAVFISFVLGVAFFATLAIVRVYGLRLLLTYRGWMYESLRSHSKKTILWSILVRLVSGYQPSLYSCQRSLPRLPVPSLKDTMERLIESLRPLCTPEELKETQDMANEFVNGIGPKIQKILILKSWWAPNYVSDWWEKYVYLMSRSPIAINSNYYVMDHSYWRPTKLQISRAANVAYYCLLFKRFIDREELPPLVLRKTIPICMAQYERLYSTTRLPGEDVDELLHYSSQDSKHIIVMCHGLLYKVIVFDSKGQVLSPNVFEELFAEIKRDAESQQGTITEEEKSLAALTALERSDWARIRKQFFSRGLNRESMDILEKAIFFLILSDYSPMNFNEKGKYLLHGDGKSIWFDKSINYIIFADGQAGANCEHSLADAPAMGHIWEYCMTKEILEKAYTEDGKCMPMPKNFRQGLYHKPSRLAWEVSAALGTKIQNALKFARRNLEDLDLQICDHDSWGKGDMKKCKISPDAFVQVALQMAYFRESGKFAQTYEASTTRLYLNGRTETVRSCTKENAAFIRAMFDDKVSKEEKQKMLRQAGEVHQKLYRDAMNGKGVDRHLFALYVACRGLGYDSKFLKKVLSRPWTLSTSQQPQQQQTNVPDCNLPVFKDMLCPGGGFGPVSDDGYGVSYMLSSEDKLFFHVSSKHSASSTSSKLFMNNIFECLELLKELFNS